MASASRHSSPLTIFPVSATRWSRTSDPGDSTSTRPASWAYPKGRRLARCSAVRAVQSASGVEVAADQVLGTPRRGRRVVFSGDTRPCPGMIEAAAAADLLIHEATFLEAEVERARQTGHTTALQAARIGRDAQVTMLALTHLSTRYLPREIRDEARAEFPIPWCRATSTRSSCRCRSGASRS